ncbi:hypothetical protein EO081_04070 [Sphingomonas desiccabilis]|uniref:Scaffolding protein n=2 Tax=Sphingomonas desiccabilis TaxID=429134 RepID=A0A4Q2J014_9SPHN|nr:hypothetical protein EO081_04070 [Sphingomonas desiccabilis]
MSEEAAEAALLESLGGDPADQNDDDQDADEDEDPSGGPADDDEGLDETEEVDEDAPEDDETPPAALDDDAVVAVEINGEAKDFKLADLKRLATEEAVITQRGQEADLLGGRAAATLQAALEAVQEDLAAYEGVDWLVLQQELDPETFAWHRQNAQRAQGRFQKLVGAAQGFEAVVAERRQAETTRAAQACVAELRSDLPGWNDKLYGEIMAYGIEAGLPEADVTAITNPKVIKLLRKAMLFDRGQKVATKKVQAAPTKVIKGGTREDGTARIADTKKAAQRLSRTGSDDDAVAVLMGRWG